MDNQHSMDIQKLLHYMNSPLGWSIPLSGPSDNDVRTSTLGGQSYDVMRTSTLGG